LISASILATAVTAAQNGTPPTPSVVAEIKAGGSMLRLEDLDFDSLGWMEFCISIELQTGAELTPDILSSLKTLADVADWIAVRRTR
jgi:acyl carrier protein